MKEWKTNLDLSQTQSNTTCKNLKTKCGIFQVDSLSSLLFCLAFIPLSFKLNETEYRYYFYELRINYQFYSLISRPCSTSTPHENVKKPIGFPMFQGGIEMEHWHKRIHDKLNTRSFLSHKICIVEIASFCILILLHFGIYRSKDV